MGEFINDIDFVKFTANWTELEGSTSPFDFFQSKSGKIILGDFLDNEDMETLFSAIGVSVIKVRFGINSVNDKTKFILILFGVDNAGERLTPYYAHTFEDLEPVSGGDPHGNVPDILADKWKNYWKNAEVITSKNFMTHSGFLQGYNYPVKELISSLFKFNIENPPKIFIGFILHKYKDFNINPSVKTEDVYTFGLLFQAVPSNEISDKTLGSFGRSDGDSGYYDLSAPCPRTC
jgi:hypothetical protein